MKKMGFRIERGYQGKPPSFVMKGSLVGVTEEVRMDYGVF